MKLFIYILFLFLFACSHDEPILAPSPIVYRQEWRKDTNIYGIREYTLSHKGTFKFTQDGDSDRVVKIDMQGWWKDVNDSVVDFTWKSLMSVTMYHDWNDTVYYHTYGIYNEDKSTMRVVTNIGTEAHSYGELFYKITQ